ncbi:hypothetical protein EVA_15076 [gut metagenome]|uniref:Uncharacterized protein n=1 Tax=gut metagenome TaxID=749906 RepID=J9G4S4_9ZZZZ
MPISLLVILKLLLMLLPYLQRVTFLLSLSKTIQMVVMI